MNLAPAAKRFITFCSLWCFFLWTAGPCEVLSPTLWQRLEQERKSPKRRLIGPTHYPRSDIGKNYYHVWCLQLGFCTYIVFVPLWIFLELAMVGYSLDAQPCERLSWWDKGMNALCLLRISGNHARWNSQYFFLSIFFSHQKRLFSQREECKGFLIQW